MQFGKAYPAPVLSSKVTWSPFFAVGSRQAALLLPQYNSPASYYRWSAKRSQSSASAGAGNSFGAQSKNSYSSSRLNRLPFYSYIKSLKWFTIPLSVGFSLLAYQHYKRVLRRVRAEQQATYEELVHKDWEIICYRKIPWNSFSRAWGWVNSITLPTWSRPHVLGWYASAYQCDLYEAESEDLKSYKNLGEFFRRGLKSGLRPIDPVSPVVAPSDGKILHLGKVKSGIIEQVKGVSYSLQTFLGPTTWSTTKDSPVCLTEAKLSQEEYTSGILKQGKDTSLYYSVIYLAPGDYHRFHSPADWTVKFRRHFTGELLSVNPSVAGWIGGLFSLNERAVYVGDWEHGFFSMTAVGATNVGSIRVYEDPQLLTNARGLKKNVRLDYVFDKPITLRKGDDFGEFNFGSTVVLIFEAPNDFQFGVENNGRVKFGEALFKDPHKPEPVPKAA